VGVSIADIASGMTAHAAIVDALYARERTGEGRALTVSMFDAVADWMTVPLLHHDYGGKAPPRVGLSHASIAPYGAFPTREGELVVFGVQNEREWRALCREVLDRPDLADDPEYASNDLRVAGRAALDATIAGVFAGLARSEATERLQRANIAFGAVNSVAGLSGHPQLRRMPVETPAGTARLPAAPARVRGESFAPGPSPALGQHSQALRMEFA
jgi:itaconate CoA-transferase